MTYAFQGEALTGHRLAFFPAPFLEEFQNSPEVYLEDDIFADIVARNVVPFPLRFDFDVRDFDESVFAHPRCHLTLASIRTAEFQ